MAGKWGLWSLGLTLLAAWGCRTPQPNLKPATQPEILAMPPPNEDRFNTPNYPKMAFKDREDPTKRFNAVDSSGIMPARGSMGGASNYAGGGVNQPSGGFNPYR